MRTDSCPHLCYKMKKIYKKWKLVLKIESL